MTGVTVARDSPKVLVAVRIRGRLPSLENIMSKADDIREEAIEQVKDSAMSEAGKKAMQFRSERNRLRQELAEMESLVEELSPATPTGTIDSYIKWLATGLAIAGVFLMSAGSDLVGQMCYAVSSICWVYVGSCWNDKAIMIGSSITGTSVFMNLAKAFL